MHARAQRNLLILAPVAASLLAVGCAAGAGPRRELASGNPLDRARGIVQVAEAQDPRALHRVVDLLEDRDEAVRMYAITALRRLCGEDLGYRFYASEAQRAAAVARWREALRNGEVSLRPGRTVPPQSQPAMVGQEHGADAAPTTAAEGGAS
jgi:hypothetical protein